MKDEVAERVLASVMEWEPPEVAKYGGRLQLLAAQKYDSYEGYRPGVKFLENLAGWLHQFDSLDDRRAAIEFVLNDLIFISRAELDHLIETVYPDMIRPLLIREVAEREGISRFAIQRVIDSEEFKQRQRRMLVLGLSDGARIDRLRRSSPGLSHEQIFLAADIGDETVNEALKSLRNRRATNDPEAQFDRVLLIDDFYGSGYTLLNANDEAKNEDERFRGRLWRTHLRLCDLADKEYLPANPKVTVIVYIASKQAQDSVRAALREVGLDWDLKVVQPLPEEIRVTDEQIVRICEEHFDPILIDSAKQGKPRPLGFGECALPLILPHNTPNNSIGILWADTTDRDEPKSLQRRALFPRYERHRDDRK